MNHLFKAMVFIVIVTFGSMSSWAGPTQPSTTEKNYFQFAIPNYETKRQGGQMVNIYVRFAYKKNLPTSEYFDYRTMREDVLKYMEPSNDYPSEVFWEILATAMGRELMGKYPLDGISIQLDVINNPDPNAFEPGDHGPIYTVGDILPLDIHH
ncbi:hypothetical protein [Legionella waltersii]|uniref:Uncharacterized protein n=1 Tax=Legionella waltersii TaxID=66969 RepID=A0A0W1AD77_9GAMM|nr:hypothetical protein [Legionella waltersii]KTD79259.1 hypothetical protein Lwal_1331 [Legionella waltersii]SNV12757.1 Uncharacterised protein [Legionella waltersii]